MKIRMGLVFALLALNFFFSLSLRAACYLEYVKDWRCRSVELASEPLHLVPHYADQTWSRIVRTPEARNLLNRKKMARLKEFSGFVHNDISMAHLVHLLSETFPQIEKDDPEFMNLRQLVPLKEGESYSSPEYEERVRSRNRAKKEVIEPMLADLYKTYMGQLAKDDETYDKNLVAKEENTVAFLKQVDAHRNFINKALLTIRPSIVEKLGNPIPVINDGKFNLPFSYRDGVIVKIRLRRPNSHRHITVYPRMVFNQIIGAEDYFLAALRSWKDYCHARWKEAKALSETSFFSPVYLYRKIASYFSGAEDPANVISKENLMKRAYDTAVRTYEKASWSHAEIKRLSEEELFSLMDMFRQLRFEDYPHCASEVHQLTFTIGEVSKNKDLDEQELAETGRDAIFYQDVYRSFSGLASLILAKQPQKKLRKSAMRQSHL